jgi:hypothetical protein
MRLTVFSINSIEDVMETGLFAIRRRGFKIHPAIFIVMLVLATTVPAFARGDRYVETKATIHRIQDIEIKGAKQEALFLGYMTTTSKLFAVLGVAVSDHGYVFGMRSDPEHFYPTTQAELKSFQERGLLPNPLPAYSLSFVDYLLGYSLWILLVPMLGFAGWSNVKRRRAARRHPNPSM